MRCAPSPDAGYLLVQHAILADQALQAAQQRIERPCSASPLRRPLPVSFLGGGQPPAPQGGYWQTQPQPTLQSPLAPNSGLGSFMRTAGTMAAGVAGGEFLANGLSNLFAPRRW